MTAGRALNRNAIQHHLIKIRTDANTFPGSPAGRSRLCLNPIIRVGRHIRAVGAYLDPVSSHDDEAWPNANPNFLW